MKAPTFEHMIIPIKDLRVVRHRDRDQEEFKELVKSLGILQIKAVFVKESGNGKYDMFSGEGRVTALKEVGQDHVRAVVFPQHAFTDKEIMLEWLSANARRDNPPLEEARLMAYDLEKGLTEEEIARRYGKKVATVRSLIRTVKTTDPGILRDVEKGDLKMHQAQDISGHLADKKEQKIVADVIKKGKLPARVTRAVIRRYSRLKSEVGKIPSRKELQQSLRGYERSRAQKNRSLDFYREKIAYLTNFTMAILDDINFLRLIEKHKIHFNDLIGGTK
jgi:ParB-like chromosome segregation protein Spo0J